MQVKNERSIYFPFLVAILLTCHLAFRANASQPNDDCSESIRKAICKVNGFTPDPNKPDILSTIDWVNRPCVSHEPLIEADILKIYKALPGSVASVMCDVKKIFMDTDVDVNGSVGDYFTLTKIEELPEGTEYKIKRIGHVLVLNYNTFYVNQESYEEWFRRFDLKVFGLNSEDPVPVGFPIIDMQVDLIPHRLEKLYKVLVHEVGHMVEASNDLIQLKLEEGFSDEGCIHDCAPPLIYHGVWRSLSWDKTGVLRKEAEFPYFELVCYTLSCAHKPRVEPKNAFELYNGFYEEPAFFTTYSTSDPREDFAESFLFYVLSLNKKNVYTLEVPRLNGESFRLDMLNPDSSYLKTKLEYMDSLFENGFKTNWAFEMDYFHPHD